MYEGKNLISINHRGYMTLYEWAVKEVHKWVNPILLQHGVVNEEGVLSDPLSDIPDGIRIVLIMYGLYGFPYMEYEFGRAWRELMEKEFSTYNEIALHLNMDGGLGGIECVESIDNPVVVIPNPPKMNKEIEDKLLFYIHQRGW